MTSPEASWPYVVNLSNSIIGVSMLALPYCLKECGIALGCLLVLGSAYLTRVSCYLLLKSAQFGRRRTYETLAMHTFGSAGKLLVELCMIGLLLGTCTAFFIIIGDLAPSIVAQIIGVESSPSLRTFLLIISATTIILPLSLKKDINSLTAYSTASLAFYGVFVILLIFSSTNLFDGRWPEQVSWWQPGGTFSVMPILSLAFSCQAQVFVLYESLQDPSVKKMTSIVNSAVDLVTAVYILVGVFGYVTYHSAGVSGDILNNYPHSFLSEALKLGFAVSVVISFPLMVFPCRVSINSLFTPQTTAESVPDEAVLIPTARFVYITLGIITGTLIVAIFVPNVEFILQLSGCTMGTAICYIFPSFMFLRLSQEQDIDRRKGQGVAVLSLLLFSLCTATVFASQGNTVATVENIVKKAAKPTIPVCTGDSCLTMKALPVNEGQQRKVEKRGGWLVDEDEDEGGKQMDVMKNIVEKQTEPVVSDETEIIRKPQPRQLQSKESAGARDENILKKREKGDRQAQGMKSSHYGEKVEGVQVHPEQSDDIVRTVRNKGKEVNRHGVGVYGNESLPQARGVLQGKDKKDNGYRKKRHSEETGQANEHTRMQERKFAGKDSEHEQESQVKEGEMARYKESQQTNRTGTSTQDDLQGKPVTKSARSLNNEEQHEGKDLRTGGKERKENSQQVTPERSLHNRERRSAHLSNVTRKHRASIVHLQNQLLEKSGQLEDLPVDGQQRRTAIADENHEASSVRRDSHPVEKSIKSITHK